MDKAALVAEILAALASEMENYARSARSAHAEATDEQSKAENKYDTRGLEASYLAKGQSRQMREVLQAMEAYQKLPLRTFAEGSAVDLGALVTVQEGAEKTHYFVGPGAGGTEVMCQGQTVIVITPSAPIGSRLLGLQAGDSVPAVQKGRAARVVAVV